MLLCSFDPWALRHEKRPTHFTSLWPWDDLVHAAKTTLHFRLFISDAQRSQRQNQGCNRMATSISNSWYHTFSVVCLLGCISPYLPESSCEVVVSCSLTNFRTTRTECTTAGFVLEIRRVVSIYCIGPTTNGTSAKSNPKQGSVAVS